MLISGYLVETILQNRANGHVVAHSTVGCVYPTRSDVSHLEIRSCILNRVIGVIIYTIVQESCSVLLHVVFGVVIFVIVIFVENMSLKINNEFYYFMSLTICIGIKIA